jgi:hypothetical protein
MAGVDRVSTFGFVRPIRGQLAHEFGRSRPEKMELIFVHGGFVCLGGYGHTGPAESGEQREGGFSSRHFNASTIVVRLCLIIPS